MKAMKLPKDLESVLKAVETSEEEAVVFTQKKKPVAALVSLRNVDKECLALGTNPEFARIIESARREVREGRTVSLDEVENHLESVQPRRKARQMQAGRKKHRGSR
jgi:PHD/YefM family antitoxin component YafN of YafNO toxin-antitoxin module